MVNPHIGTHGGYMHIAAIIMKDFCPRLDLFNIVEYLSQIKEILEKVVNADVIEGVELKNKPCLLANYLYKYECYCQVHNGKSQNESKVMRRC